MNDVNQSVLIIGGSGFIGSHLTACLANTDWDVTVVTRHYEHAKHLLVLPKVEILEANVFDSSSLKQLLKGKDAVINLVGILHSRPALTGQSYGPDFAKAHVELPQKIVSACSVSGVKRYLHMSALGANNQAPSMYLRSKADGEIAALSNPYIGTTIFRPSVVFGPEDHFLNLFAHLQKFLPIIFMGRTHAKFQPIYVKDVAQAFANALDNPRTIGKTYELGGPDIYTLHELVKLSGIFSGHLRPIVNLSDELGRLQALFLEHMPGGPLMSRDNFDSMAIDNVLKNPIDPEIGITPVRLENIAPTYLKPHSLFSRFDAIRMRSKR